MINFYISEFFKPIICINKNPYFSSPRHPGSDERTKHPRSGPGRGLHRLHTEQGRVRATGEATGEAILGAVTTITATLIARRSRFFFEHFFIKEIAKLN